MRDDLRYAFRELLRKPSVAITAILSLTLGIGATIAVFSVIYSFLANPFPYKAADRMVHLVAVNEKGEDNWFPITGPQLKALQQTNAIESAAATWGTWNLTTTDEDLPQDVPSTQLTGNAGLFFGVPALYGRTILPSDTPEGQEPQPIVVLAYKFWQRHFHADPSVVGRNLQLVHKNYTIIGVMPPRFTWDDADVYLPLKLSNDPNVTYGPLVRLKHGITHEAANAELQPLFEQFAKDLPDRFPKKFRMRVKGLNDQFVERVGPSLSLLFGAVGLLLLIGCANVSILLLARGTARQHELAVRSAIGASRWRIQRQLLTEALVLSLAGASLGVLLAYRLLPMLIRWFPDYAIPHEVDIRINVPALLFAVGLALVTGTVSGLAPAFQFSSPHIAQLIQSTSRRATGGARGKRTHGILVAGQIALTLLLMTSSAAAINGFVKLVRTELGYDPHHTISVGIPVHEKTHGTWEDRSHYFRQLLARVQAIPGVEAAAISSNATPPSNGQDYGFEIFGSATKTDDRMRTNFVSSEYFAVLKIPLQQGRLWDQVEVNRGARLAVINQSAAKRYWPNGDAVGKQLRLPDMKNGAPFVLAAAESNSWLQVIGVVADARDDGLRKPVKPAIYVPYPVQMVMYTQILVRTKNSPLSLLNQIRAEVKSVDPDQQIMGQTRDLEQWIEREDEYAYGRLVATLFSAFSMLALALAAIGLFSVVSYGVAQRTNEFGLRMALGATQSQVLGHVLGSTARTVMGGVAGGVVLTVVLSKIIMKWADGSSHDPLLFGGAVLLLLLTAAVAACIPARRAAAVDPMEALRYD